MPALKELKEKQVSLFFIPRKLKNLPGMELTKKVKQRYPSIAVVAQTPPKRGVLQID
jgi:DNA-binding NarL/FixJ family response regulator